MKFEGRKTEEDFTSWIGVTRPYKQFSQMLQRFFTHVASSMQIYGNKRKNSTPTGLVWLEHKHGRRFIVFTSYENALLQVVFCI